MFKKIVFIFTILLSFSGVLYAEDKPLETLYNALESKLEYDTSTLSGVRAYKQQVDRLVVSNIGAMGDLRTVITFDEPLNRNETFAFLERYKIVPAQVIRYSIDPKSGLLVTSACIKPQDGNLNACFSNDTKRQGNFIGTVAIYTFTSIDTIEELRKDQRIYLVDYSGDPRRYSLRSKVATNWLSADVQPFVGDRHHVAWPLYIEKLGLQSKYPTSVK